MILAAEARELQASVTRKESGGSWSAAGCEKVLPMEERGFPARVMWFLSGGSRFPNEFEAVWNRRSMVWERV